MKAIIAKNNLGYIGLNDKLPWGSKEDLQHFKKLTTKKVLLCGFNTFKTLPVVVKERTMVYCDERETDPRQFVESNKHLEIWCIGGKKTYEKYAPYFTELHVSQINDNTIGDCMYPNLKTLNPNCKIFNYSFDAE